MVPSEGSPEANKNKLVLGFPPRQYKEVLLLGLPHPLRPTGRLRRPHFQLRIHLQGRKGNPPKFLKALPKRPQVHRRVPTLHRRPHRLPRHYHARAARLRLQALRQDPKMGGRYA